jgi:hypothetical protein
MVKEKSFIGFLVVMVVVLLGVFGWLAVNFVVRVVPNNSATQYFMSSNESLPGLDWPLDRFKPVYLWRNTENGGVYFYVLYRDAENKIKFAKVFAGGSWSGTKSPVLKINDGETADKYPLKLGERVMIVFLEEAKTAPDKEEVKKIVCETTPAVCGLASYVESVGGLTNVVKGKQFPKGVIVPAIKIFVMLENK